VVQAVAVLWTVLVLELAVQPHHQVKATLAEMLLV
jgi:uncharacterized membrane protein